MKEVALIERVQTYAIVTVLALVAWLFAEAESLGSLAASGLVRFTAPGEMVRVEAVDGFDGQVELQLSGPRSGLDRVRELLSKTVRLEAGSVEGLPAATGDYVVDLAEAIASLGPVRNAGVVVDDTRPQRVSVRVTRLVDVSVDVVADVDDVDAEDVTVSVPTAEVRMSRSAWEESGPEGLAVIARPTPEQLADLPSAGTERLDVPLTPNDALRATGPVQVLTQRATLTVTIRSTFQTAELPVPVQILLPSSEQGRWSVELAPEDAVLTVTVRGPVDSIERLGSARSRLVATLALSSDDLAGGIESKRVGFVLLRDGVATPLPEGMTLTPDRETVRFRASRIEGAGDG